MIITRLEHSSGYTEKLEISDFGEVKVSAGGRHLLNLGYEDRQKIIDALYRWMSNNHDQLGHVIEGITDTCGSVYWTNQDPDNRKHELNLEEQSNEEYYKMLPGYLEELKAKGKL